MEDFMKSKRPGGRGGKPDGERPGNGQDAPPPPPGGGNGGGGAPPKG
jgi:hypothetical protein